MKTLSCRLWPNSQYLSLLTVVGTISGFIKVVSSKGIVGQT
jgi:hypothetical protein